MTRDEFAEICEWAEQRDATLYRWLRHLILLGTGSLSVLVSLQPLVPASGAAAVCQQGAWATLGLGILLAAVRLYGEVWAAKAKVEQLVTRRRSPPPTSAAAANAPIVWTLPWWILRAEPACYGSFVLAVLFLVVGAILRTRGA